MFPFVPFPSSDLLKRRGERQEDELSSVSGWHRLSIDRKTKTRTRWVELHLKNHSISIECSILSIESKVYAFHKRDDEIFSWAFHGGVPSSSDAAGKESRSARNSASPRTSAYPRRCCNIDRLYSGRPFSASTDFSKFRITWKTSFALIGGVLNRDRWFGFQCIVSPPFRRRVLFDSS